MDSSVSPTDLENKHQESLSRGRQHASGGGRADGGALGAPGSDAPCFGPRFDSDVVAGGYLWWYLDGLSDDGRFAITLIAFIGSVFSPYYAWSGRRDPLNHCAFNVALYGKPGARWAMTERGRPGVVRSNDSLQIGPSSLRWRGGILEIEIDEICAPIPRRISGSIRVIPSGFVGQSFRLGAAGSHVWQPIAPRARIELTLNTPAISWNGSAYLDSNHGSEPLEMGFKEWTWSRAHLARDTIVFYDAQPREADGVSMAFRFDPGGRIQAVVPPPQTTLPPTAWRISRRARTDLGQTVAIHRVLEDTPFYARTQLATRVFGETAECFHESLSLHRFASPLVRAMLPFRMPRRFF